MSVFLMIDNALGNLVVGVFETREKAERYVNEQDLEDVRIEEWEVE